jgi:uncharacterized peroxidase-related enzyme
MSDYRTAALAPADRAMLDFAVKLTRTPAGMSAGDIDALRGHAFDDLGISHIVQIASAFNYFNRIVDGLGVDDEPEWGG